ncbi:ligase-associated DNA damage response exonuclease [Jannaschia ovalis]|uniref:Ligase-associated DNA damage response exonuclease n=1 Tax=Jannaschia ovalis TaxID=3038773 RepID=A0ABY8LC10_9RHOB|nr:ligase-associated DNA damage response exonuclease [Jannaschia sp. GRR-S6-38]WGH78864.1 ligase-associated DNA damage response exonuclease [Jannaschia sp. GRR-S6-38]
MVLEFTDDGIWCPAGGFHIDPWRPVDRALVTHGHADHAYPGHRRYLATDAALPVMRHRLGDITAEGIAFGETREIGGVRVSFHPAGHVPGSAQIRVEHKGEVWVVSGDYKTAPDALSEPWEPVRCHAFITECTFGLPVFDWAPETELRAQIDDWWRANRDAGRFSLIGAYSLGKAQRVMTMVDPSIGPILTHGAVENTNEVLRAQGVELPATIRVTAETDLKAHAGALVIAPPGALAQPWARRFGRASQGIASGWMALRGVRRRRSADRGFVVSDHADWKGLNAAVKETGASRIFATHGYTSTFRDWLESQGYEARIVQTEFGDELLETEEAEA